jgi:ABC-type branched-subunit amino acid transport system substrate-binding protein
MINDQGGINGRKVNFISRDDGYSPPKTVEMVRKLVEEDQVLLMFGTLGTPPNTAIWGYLNDNKVPQLFVTTGADKWNDPKHHPWTMGWLPTYQTEGRIYARYILKNLPDAKIAVLYQNDDFGKDYLTGLRDGLGDKADKMIVANHRSDRRFADRGVARQRRQCSDDGGDFQICRAGDPQSLRHRMEADVFPQLYRELGGRRDAPSRA